MKTFSIRNATLSACLGALMSAAPALPAQLDLNEFYPYEDDDNLERNEDGSEAILSEDDEFSSVILELDPFLGDPDLIIPVVGTFLRFEFDFIEPEDNDDVFVAFLFGSSAEVIDLGPMFEFTTDQTDNGTVEFDLSSLVGTTLGLHFALIAADDDLGLDSSLTITNVRLDNPVEQPTIPEGGTATLFVSGLAAIGLFRRWMKN